MQERALLYELYEGGSLDNRLYLAQHFELTRGRGGREFTWGERMRVLVDSCMGLAVLHSCELVHCDIKPGNILIGLEGQVRLLLGPSPTLDHGFQP